MEQLEQLGLPKALIVSIKKCEWWWERASLWSQWHAWIWVFSKEGKWWKPHLAKPYEQSRVCNRTGFVNDSAHPGITSLPSRRSVHKNTILRDVGIQKSVAKWMHSVKPLYLWGTCKCFLCMQSIILSLQVMCCRWLFQFWNVYLTLPPLPHCSATSRNFIS